MPRIVDRLVAAKRTGMFAHDVTVVPDDDAIGISMDLGRAADGRRLHGVFVVV